MSFNQLKSSISDGMLRSFDHEKVYIKCPHCGEAALVDMSMVLTSYPPQYNYYCEHCGHRGYTRCSEVERSGWAEIPKNDDWVTSFSAPCLICGEPVPVSMLDSHSQICEKCKKAILKLRKMLEDADND